MTDETEPLGLAEVLSTRHPDLIEAQVAVLRAHEDREQYFASVRNETGERKRGMDWTKEEREKAQGLTDAAVGAAADKEDALRSSGLLEEYTHAEVAQTLKDLAKTIIETGAAAAVDDAEGSSDTDEDIRRTEPLPEPAQHAAWPDEDAADTAEQAGAEERELAGVHP